MKSNLCCSYTLGCSGVLQSWSMVNFPGATLFNKTDSPSLISCKLMLVPHNSSEFSLIAYGLSSPDNDARCGLYLVEQVLNPMRQWLTTHIAFMSLFHQWACLTRTVIIVAHSLAVLTITLLLW